MTTTKRDFASEILGKMMRIKKVLDENTVDFNEIDMICGGKEFPFEDFGLVLEDFIKAVNRGIEEAKEILATDSC